MTQDWDDMVERPSGLPRTAVYVFCDGCGSWDQWVFWVNDPGPTLMLEFWIRCSGCGHLEDLNEIDFG